jgi:pathogenesis-related protein 1
MSMYMQRLAVEENCAMKHSSGDERSASSDKWSYVGENLYAYWTSGKLYDNDIPGQGYKAVNGWFNELKYYVYPENGAYSDCPKRGAAGATGHFTQVMWEATTHIGCDYATCGEGNLVAGCVYGPGGNFGGQKMFQMANRNALDSWSGNEWGGLPTCR